MILPRVIQFGPITFHIYGLILALAIFAGWYLAKKRARIYKIPKQIFDDPILLIPLILSIAGARLYHVLDLWSYYSRNLVDIFKIQNGGLGIWGGIIGMILGFFVVVKIKNLDLLTSFDLAAPSIILGQAIGRIGNFVNQEGFGPPTNLPWGVFVDSQNRPSQYLLYSKFHPTFFYEAALNLIFFLLLLYFAGKLKVKGRVFALYLIFYSTARSISEIWRIDTWQVEGFKIAYLFSAGAFVLGLVLFTKLQRRG